jgi:hypothetical protein
MTTVRTHHFAASIFTLAVVLAAGSVSQAADHLAIATFKVDATPPIGSPIA